MRRLNVIVEESTPAELEDLERFRPKTRSDCVDMPRPCPFVSCKYNTYLTVTELGTIEICHKVPVEDLDPEVSNCALDYEFGAIEKDIGKAMGITTQGVNNMMRRLIEHAKHWRGSKRPNIDELVGGFLDPLAGK